MVPGTNGAFPDTCNVITPAGTIPTTFFNVDLSTTHLPGQIKTLVECTLAHNGISFGTLSNGDEAGLAMGILSGLIIGPGNWETFSLSTYIGGIPVTRLLDLLGQNGFLPNAPGASMSPGQVGTASVV